MENSVPLEKEFRIKRQEMNQEHTVLGLEDLMEREEEGKSTI